MCFVSGLARFCRIYLFTHKKRLWRTPQELQRLSWCPAVPFTQGLCMDSAVVRVLPLRKASSPWSVLTIHVLSPDELFLVVPCPVACRVGVGEIALCVCLCVCVCMHHITQERAQRKRAKGQTKIDTYHMHSACSFFAF